MTKPFSVLAKPFFILLFACVAVPAFAQRGGGHAGGGGGMRSTGGGGGFHGGGGIHGGGPGGGGMRSAGGGGFNGGRASAPPVAGYGGRSFGSAPVRPGGNFAPRPAPSNSFAGANRQFGNSSAAPPPPAGGGWHSFGGPAGNRGPSGTQNAPAPANAGNFHVFSGNRPTAGLPGSLRSFSGQGGDVWENSAAARNVIPKSQSLSTLHNSFAANPGTRPGSSLSASSRVGSAPSFTGASRSAAFANGARRGPEVQQQLRGSVRSGAPFERFGRGCWNCGFGWRGRGWGHRDWGGWGWGFGWGSPWIGFWGWDPFWVDPWWGWSTPGYGFYASPDYSLYGSASQSMPVPNYDSGPPAQQDSGDNSYNHDDSAAANGNWVTPNEPGESPAPHSTELTVPVLIYMKNGTVRTVRDYWMLDGELHFILMNGTQHSVDLEQVDLPRTNTENAKSGVKFIFKSAPSVTSPDDQPDPPDEQPTSPNQPAPTHQLDAVPHPEAHT